MFRSTMSKVMLYKGLVAFVTRFQGHGFLVYAVIAPLLYNGFCDGHCMYSRFQGGVLRI